MSNGNDGTGGGKSADQIAVETNRALRASRVLVEDVLILARQKLQRNPSPDERRALDRQIVDLEEQLTRIRDRMGALLARGTALTPPTQAQVDEIAALAGRVQQQRNQAVAASMTLALGTDVLACTRGAAFG